MSISMVVRNMGACCEKMRHDVKFKCDVSGQSFEANSSSPRSALFVFTALLVLWSLRSGLDRVNSPSLQCCEGARHTRWGLCDLTLVEV